MTSPYAKDKEYHPPCVKSYLDGDTEIKSIPSVFIGYPGEITVTFIPDLTKPLAKCVEYAPSPDQ